MRPPATGITRPTVAAKPQLLGLVTAVLLTVAGFGRTAVGQPAAQPNDGRMAGFAHRQQTGRGRYLTQADVARVHPMSFSQFLRMAASPIRIIDYRGSQVVISRRGNKSTYDAAAGRLTDEPCIARLMIDGRLQAVGADLDTIDPGSIAGVEIYDGPAGVPAELSRGGKDEACGLVVVWTRAG